MEQQTGTAMNEADAKRQRKLASLVKARAAAAVARAAKKAAEPAKKAATPLKDVYKERGLKMLEDQAVKKNDPPDNWLDGIHHAPNGCPHACNATCCVITGENVCAHPDTNLQSKYLTGGFPDVVDRFNAARMEIRRLDAERSLKK